MDADWYEDPLGRYEGRFFDGDRWTERVSSGGSLVTDPDFPPVASADAAENDRADRGDALTNQHEFDTANEPAVAKVAPREQLKASLIEESPVRTVAVLDSSVTGDRDGPPAGKDRSFLLWGLLCLVGILAIAGLLLWRSSDDAGSAVAEAVDLDEQQEERVQDLAEGGTDAELDGEVIEELDVDAPVGAVEPGTVFGSGEVVEVGALRVLNGTSVLGDLEEWHRDFAAERGVELGPEAGCWFGQLGGAAVQLAQCGPVGGSAESEFLFDSVPLLFEEANGGQIAQPVVDAVTVDAVLANALTLVGSVDSPTPPLSLEGATSGDNAEDPDE